MLLGSMADESSSTIVVVPPRRSTILNETHPSHKLVISNVHAHASLKLIAMTYYAWRLQFMSLLFEYDLLDFVDGSKMCPLTMVTLPNAASPSPNPDYFSGSDKTNFSDVWTSLVSSSDGFNYYVTFVDHYTKYIWLYPFCQKSNVHLTFVAFKQLVENYFTTTIKTLKIDNGGDFLAISSFLATHGITHLTTPPHTLEHNGYFEHWHRHTVKT